jgi:hypothetical protein
MRLFASKRIWRGFRVGASIPANAKNIDKLEKAIRWIFKALLFYFVACFILGPIVFWHIFMAMLLAYAIVYNLVTENAKPRTKYWRGIKGYIFK